jgi:hypothetical protein
MVRNEENKRCWTESMRGWADKEEIRKNRE